MISSVSWLSVGAESVCLVPNCLFGQTAVLLAISPVKGIIVVVVTGGVSVSTVGSTAYSSVGSSFISSLPLSRSSGLTSVVVSFSIRVNVGKYR